MIRRTALALALAAPLLLAGCVGVTSSKDYTSNPTLGQELLDLQKAYDSGAITEQEYKELKSAAIERGKSTKRR